VTNVYDSSVNAILRSYTLCRSALSYYSLDPRSELPDEAWENDDWMSEYRRVCKAIPTALPTSGFNTSISLDYTPAATGATATTTMVSRTATPMPGPTSTNGGLAKSPDGTCGSGTGYTCEGSRFGECCSEYGYCGSGKDYCVTHCDAAFGLCKISPDGTCGGDAGYSCSGSQFGSCCSKFGYCGSGDDYCTGNCDAGFGDCNASPPKASSTSTTSPSSNVSPDGTCGGTTGYTCAGSQFGSCCSKYGYCGATGDFCGSNCDPDSGKCGGN
jgi:hypothetical protein